MKVMATFQLQNGVVIAIAETTDLPVGKPLKAVITHPDGQQISAPAFKEWLLRRSLEPIEGEAFLLRGLQIVDVPARE